MTLHALSVSSVERRLSTGNLETLRFEPGVNLFVGRPNTGKTKWLQTLDYLLGDLGENPFAGAEEEGLADKYDAASVDLVIGEEQFRVERRWREQGAKSKILVNGESMQARDFQQFLLQKLGIPLLHFPKGNPMSGQTWPELSFRMLLRHIYRRQLFWGDIADLQPEGEQHACLLQFLGLAERLFSDEYGNLIKLKMDTERLRARRDQYRQTLDELSKDILSVPGVSVGANVTTVRNAENRLLNEVNTLRERRRMLIANGLNEALPPDDRGHVEQLGEERANILVRLEDLQHKAKEVSERLGEMRTYRVDLDNELDRIARAEDAGAVLADLKITHCPACDQPVANTRVEDDQCFLCHQDLPNEPVIEELGAVRVRFEHDRLIGEIQEADELIAILERDVKSLADSVLEAKERLKMLENELAPARQAVSALVQEEISGIDMALGELNERQRQLSRVSAALELGDDLTERIRTIELQIQPLGAAVDEAMRATDFDEAATLLEDGMNAYLTAINTLKPGIWLHNPVVVDISRSRFSFRVGTRRWRAALGGTDTLYFLMAYQYGLLTLSGKPGYHYPGLSIIDVPGEFSGEDVEDTENFIVQPFIDLFARDAYQGCQLIITGASFEGLDGAHRQQLTQVHVA